MNIFGLSIKQHILMLLQALRNSGIFFNYWDIIWITNRSDEEIIDKLIVSKGNHNLQP